MTQFHEKKRNVVKLRRKKIIIKRNFKLGTKIIINDDDDDDDDDNDE